MKAPRCISVGVRKGTMQEGKLVSGCGLEWCGVRQENRPTASRCRVSYPQEVEGWSKVSTSFLYIGSFVQTTSCNASKAVLQTGPSVVVGPTLPAQQKK